MGDAALPSRLQDLLGMFEVLGDPHYVILDYIATVPDRTEPVAGTDVSEARWIPLDEVDALECTPRFVETMRAWGVEV